jgi:hypothetical protein
MSTQKTIQTNAKSAHPKSEGYHSDVRGSKEKKTLSICCGIDYTLTDAGALETLFCSMDNILLPDSLTVAI